MQPTDKKRFAQVMLAISEYYQRELSDAVLQLYWRGLEQYDVAAIESAVERHMRSPDTGQHLPKIADVIRMIGGTSNDAALVAWSKVDKAVRHIGTYRTVVFDDHLIHRAVQEMGGWILLGSKTEDEWPFVAREFENRYRGLRTTDGGREYPAKLLGIFDRENGHQGYAEDPPVLIGDTDLAMAVLKGGATRPLLAMVDMRQAGANVVALPTANKETSRGS